MERCEHCGTNLIYEGWGWACPKCGWESTGAKVYLTLKGKEYAKFLKKIQNRKKEVRIWNSCLD